ncbi:nucleoside hydrolase, partial [Bacillus altitudinis]|uniref:nucleoside hydrolase n=1 Tax=Bacillus altitudinis TaxID=293387 RepID=UPI0011A2E7A2
HHVKQVIFMAGLVQGQGNVTPVAQFNTYPHPEPTKFLLHPRFPSFTQLPLHLTTHLFLTHHTIPPIQNQTLPNYITHTTTIYPHPYFHPNPLSP